MALRRLAAEHRKAALHDLLLAEPLLWTPGSRSDYSDLGYMLLEWIVERASGSGLADFVDAAVYRPLGIGELFFNATGPVRGSAAAYAATQLCPWRAALLEGRVDDDNAFILGGVGGHAGLFGTARAVSDLLASLLAADGRGFEPALVGSFLRADAGERWALGFDTPSRSGSSAGRHFPADSVGHLGFTGTSFWLHRGRGIIVVLLTNRVHPWRFNPGIKAFRPRLHDAVMEAL
jgi:CubicO group peptidase (beta-lactamase class C family)